MKHTIWITGRPRPQPRGRTYQGRTVSNIGPVKEWKKAIALQLGTAPKGLEGPLTINLSFYFDRPKAHYNSKGEIRDKYRDPRCIARIGDKDNLEKAVLDTLESKGVILNDTQVWAGTVQKQWVTKKHQEEGVLIEIWDNKETNVWKGHTRD